MLYDASCESFLLKRPSTDDSLQISPRSSVKSTVNRQYDFASISVPRSDHENQESKANALSKSYHPGSPSFNDIDYATRPGLPATDTALSAAKEPEYLHTNSDEFITPIRSHGAPLDTITERTSVVTLSNSDATTNSRLPSSAATSIVIRSISSATFSQSYPGCVAKGYRCKRNVRDLRPTKSVREELFESHRDLPSACTIAENFQHATGLLGPPNGTGILSSASLKPFEELVDVPSSSSTYLLVPISRRPVEQVKRPTSPYLREIYLKLARLGRSSVHGSTCQRAISPSKIPIPSRFIKQRVNENLDPLGEKFHDLHKSNCYDTSKAFVAKPFKSTITNDVPCTNISSLQSTIEEPDSLSDVTHDSRSTMPFLTDSQDDYPFFDPFDQNEPLPFHRCITPKNETTLPRCLPSESLDVETERIEQPSAGSTPSPPNITVRNRSIFDVRANERGLAVDLALTRYSLASGNVTPPLQLRCTNSSEEDAASSFFSSRQSSREVPLNQFPNPPSPNIIVTPPPYQISRDLKSPYQQIASKKDSDCQTFCSLYQTDTSDSENKGMSEIFPKLPIVYNIGSPARSMDSIISTAHEVHQRIAGAEGNDEQSSLASCDSPKPTSPIHMPSPLRPRSRPNSKYVLFPETPAAPQPPVLRTLRSVSSMLRHSSRMRRVSTSREPLSTSPAKQELVSADGPKVEGRENGMSNKSLCSLLHKQAQPRKAKSKRSKKLQRCFTREALCFLHRSKSCKENNGNKSPLYSTRQPIHVASPFDALTSQPASNGTNRPVDTLSNPDSPSSVQPILDILTKQDAPERRHWSSRQTQHREPSSKLARLPRILRACFCQVTDDDVDADGWKAQETASPDEISALHRAVTRAVIE